MNGCSWNSRTSLRTRSSSSWFVSQGLQSVMLGNPLPTSLTSSNAAKAAWMGSCEGCPMNRSSGNSGNTQGKGQQDHTSKCKPFQTVEQKKSKQIQTACLPITSHPSTSRASCNMLGDTAAASAKRISSFSSFKPQILRRSEPCRCCKCGLWLYLC